MDEKDLQQDIPVVIEEDNEYEELLRSFEVPEESEKIKKNHKILRYAVPLMIFVLLTGAAVAISVAPKPQTTAMLTLAFLEQKQWWVKAEGLWHN